MKNILGLFVFSILFVFNSLSQNLSVSALSANSVSISFSLTEDDTLYIYENDTVYFEDFSLLPSSGGEVYKNFFWHVPASHLKTPGAMLKDIVIDTNRGILIRGKSRFFTGNIDISKALCIDDQSLNNGQYAYRLKIVGKRKNATFNPTITDLNGNSINLTELSDDTLYSATSSIGFYFSKNNNKSDTLLSVLVAIPQGYCNKLSFPILNTQTSFVIDNLKANTNYVLALGGDTLSFFTHREKTIDSVKHISDNSATVFFSDNSPNTNKKIIVVNKGDSYSFADDIFISEFSYYKNNAVELFNATGKDICLKDYSLKLHAIQSFVKTFSEKDTLKHNSSIVLFNSFDVPYQMGDKGLFYYVSSLFYGHKPIILLHNNDTVDIFGNVNELSLPNNTGWSCNEGNFNTARFILKRKSFVCSGIKHNPNAGFPTLCSEWSALSPNDTNNFANFGIHSFDNIISQEEISNINFGIPIDEGNIQISDEGYCLINNLNPNSFYVAYLVSQDGSTTYDFCPFLTKARNQRIASGLWSDSNWTNGIPKFNHIVTVASDIFVTIPQDSVAFADTLILKNNTSLLNLGSMNIKNFIVEKSFLGYYSNNIPGWYLFSIPITIDENTIGSIPSYFNADTNNNNVDIYTWKEDFLQDTLQGMWLNFKAYNDTVPFFQQSKALLIAYANDTTINFSGSIADYKSYTLLNNASLTTYNPNSSGWHLVSNPYPFPISINQIARNNISLPNKLNPYSGNYEPLTLQDTLSPFEGFFVQVANTQNFLSVTKISNNNLAQNNISTTNNPLIFSITDSSLSLSDNLYLSFDSNASDLLDWEYDSHKLHSLGSCPEIFAKFHNENFSVNVIPPNNENSLLVDIRCLIKHSGNYSVCFNQNSIYPYDSVLLINRYNGQTLANLSATPVFSFLANEDFTEDSFLLKFTRNALNLNNISINDNNIYILQDNNLVTAKSNSHINLMSLYSIDGRLLQQISDNHLFINNKGAFILTVSTQNGSKSFKIVIP